MVTAEFNGLFQSIEIMFLECANNQDDGTCDYCRNKELCTKLWTRLSTIDSHGLLDSSEARKIIEEFHALKKR